MFVYMLAAGSTLSYLIFVLMKKRGKRTVYGLECSSFYYPMIVLFEQKWKRDKLFRGIRTFKTR